LHLAKLADHSSQEPVGDARATSKSIAGMSADSGISVLVPANPGRVRQKRDGCHCESQSRLRISMKGIANNHFTKGRRFCIMRHRIKPTQGSRSWKFSQCSS
jgi:hypothetical protein